MLGIHVHGNLIIFNNYRKSCSLLLQVEWLLICKSNFLVGVLLTDGSSWLVESYLTPFYILNFRLRKIRWITRRDTVKLGYNELFMSTDRFVITGLICVLNWLISLKNIFVIAGFVFTKFHGIYKKYPYRNFTKSNLYHNFTEAWDYFHVIRKLWCTNICGYSVTHQVFLFKLESNPFPKNPLSIINYKYSD